MNNRIREIISRGNAIRAGIFICLIVLAFLVCNHFFAYADTNRTQVIMDEFYDLDENTVDVVYFGSSVTQRAYAEPLAYHDYGIAAYSMACGSQPFVLTKYLMIEALKTQKPELFIVDLKRTCDEAETLRDIPVRRMVDNIKFSKNKIDMIQAVIDFAGNDNELIDKTGLSYYIPLIRYHSRWNPSKQPEVWDDIDYYKGFTLDANICFRIKAVNSIEYNEDMTRISQESEDALKDLLDYCDTLDSQVLFLIPPYAPTEYGMRRLNYSKSLCEERGYEVLNFLPPEKKKALGIDDRYCYYNNEHMNYNGTQAYTDYLSRYISKNYKITDRRGDKRHKGWEDDYKRLMHNLETTYSEKYEAMLAKTEKIKAGDR